MARLYWYLHKKVRMIPTTIWQFYEYHSRVLWSSGPGLDCLAQRELDYQVSKYKRSDSQQGSYSLFDWPAWPHTQSELDCCSQLEKLRLTLQAMEVIPVELFNRITLLSVVLSIFSCLALYFWINILGECSLHDLSIKVFIPPAPPVLHIDI